MDKKTKTSFYEDEGHLIARSQRPAPLKTPKPPSGLAPGDLLNKDLTRTIVYCAKCKTPLMEVYPIKILTQFSQEQKPAKALGPWEAPKRADDKCPCCKNYYADYDSKSDRAKYLTDKGWV